MNNRAYFNNGVSFRDCGEPDQVEAGEVFFDHIPTEEELIAVFPDYVQAKKEFDNTIATINRSNAYKEESDSIFFKWQRNEATQQEWLDKVSEIKQRFPKVK